MLEASKSSNHTSHLARIGVGQEGTVHFTLFPCEVLARRSGLARHPSFELSLKPRHTICTQSICPTPGLTIYFHPLSLTFFAWYLMLVTIDSACTGGKRCMQSIFTLAYVPYLHAGIRVYTGCIDAVVNDKGYIVPGLGDAGDRAFGNLSSH